MSVPVKNLSSDVDSTAGVVDMRGIGSPPGVLVNGRAVRNAGGELKRLNLR
jgi:hypothetical protein